MRKLTLALGLLYGAFRVPALAQHDHGAHAHGATPAAAEAKTEAKAAQQKTCPVSGKPVDPNVSTEYEGQNVQFCSKGCVDKFKADPMQYVPAVYRQLYPQRVQTRCPVMGGKVDPKVSIEHGGQQVYFCCKGCDRKFQANPDKYLPKMAEVSTEQVHCPVSGKAINPTVVLKHEGKEIYFCCEGCIPEYKAAPARYQDALRPTAGLLAYGKTTADDLVVCPLCLEEGAHKRSEGRVVERGGMNYILCSDGCAGTFKADPDKHAKALRDQMIKRAGGPQKAFTCSMHPDIVSRSPGQCPICAMKLTSAAGK